MNSGCEYVEELGATAAGCNIVEYLAQRYPSAAMGGMAEARDFRPGFAERSFNGHGYGSTTRK